MLTVLRVIGRLIPSALSSASDDSATPCVVDKLHGGRARRVFDNVRAVDVPPGHVLFYGPTARLEFPESHARPSRRQAGAVRLFDRGRDDRRRRAYRSTGHVQERHRLRDRQREQAGRGQADIQELLQRLSGPVQRECTAGVRCGEGSGGRGRADVSTAAANRVLERETISLIFKFTVFLTRVTGLGFIRSFVCILNNVHFNIARS